MVTIRYFNIPDTFKKDLYVLFDKHFWDLWLNYLAPKLLAITPYETRQLQRAMVAARRGGNFTIGFRSYAYYWRFLPEMRAEYQRIFDAELPAMLQFAYQRAKKDVGRG